MSATGRIPDLSGSPSFIGSPSSGRNVAAPEVAAMGSCSVVRVGITSRLRVSTTGRGDAERVREQLRARRQRDE
ncbi:MAG: hypothetical protein WBF75_16470 [Pseudonocardiaceae bacterium]